MKPGRNGQLGIQGELKIADLAWNDPRADAMREAQQAEIRGHYDEQDTEPGTKPSASDVAVFLAAFREGSDEPLACGGLRRLDERHGEIKRMYAVPAARGTGAAVAVLRALEDRARAFGWERVVLETGDRQFDAIRFYEREGFTPIPLFGHYADSEFSVCYEKRL